MAVRNAHLRTVATPGRLDDSGDRQLELLGSPLPVKYLAMANLRFDRRVVPEPLGCQIWTGAKDRDGYGKFRLGERAVAAHRFAYERTKGIIPERMQVDHICIKRACVNPDHLQLATPRQNSALSRTRAGNPSSYGRLDARNDGLAVDLADLGLSGSESTTKSGESPWVPALVNGVWDQAEEGWSDLRFLN